MTQSLVPSACIAQMFRAPNNIISGTKFDVGIAASRRDSGWHMVFIPFELTVGRADKVKYRSLLSRLRHQT
jgi:hypothetical protein